ncbi:MAG: adenylate/guanylate cyclase domain-containing protein [Bdellovibrionales bacterium]
MKQRFRIPIAFKLIFITVGLLLGVSMYIAMKSTNRFEQISTDRETQSNRDQSRARANEIEGLLLAYIEKTKVIGEVLYKKQGEERDRSLDITFGRDKDFVAVEVLSKTPGAAVNRVVNEEFLKQYKLDKQFIDTLRVAQKAKGLVRVESLFGGKDGYIEIRNSTIEGGAPVFKIGFPLVKDEFGAVTHVVLAEIRLDRLQKAFATVSERTIYLIDSEGRLLAHPDEKRVLKGENMRKVPIVEAALNSDLKQGQLAFSDAVTKESFTGAYTKTALGVTSIAVASDEVILEAARSVRREAFSITGKGVSVALFLMFLVSITLTMPIEVLAELTNEVAKGNFAVKAKVSSRDEVGQLGEAFNHMIEGLLERDKVKNMFSKFHGSSVTDDLMKGDLQLGGSKKNVTVFFSDIRDFTKFSEGHTPEEVVAMLNEYFEVMVGLINKHGGVVDKFIGDAIMAVWGAPKETDRDRQMAVRAALEMRRALAVLNEKRLARGHVAIKIGMGLHCGEAISGTIGSQERMEYTVIGDTVNQASRIEASTKSFGTDLLLSDDLAAFAKDEYMMEVAGSVEVKGKSEPLKLYKVRGYYDENKNPVEITTPYSDYEAGHDAKVKIAG